MDYPWVIDRLSIDYPWIKHGLSIDYPWIIQRLFIYPWIIHRLSMDYAWIIHSLSMDYSEIIHGLSRDYPWIIHGLSSEYPFIHYNSVAAQDLEEDLLKSKSMALTCFNLQCRISQASSGMPWTWFLPLGYASITLPSRAIKFLSNVASNRPKISHWKIWPAFEEFWKSVWQKRLVKVHVWDPSF